MKMASSTAFMGASAAVVVIAIVAAIIIVGSPENARMHRLDDERVQVVQVVSGAVRLYFDAHRSLPGTLEQLAIDTSHVGALGIRDPETELPIEYRKTGANAYELCARFSTEVHEEGNSAWNHSKGRQCFKFTASEH